MIIYGGIDEAGFGPLIGPLVISLTLFKVDNVPTSAPPPMWEILKESITRSRKDPQKRIPIDDSKKLQGFDESFIMATKPNDAWRHLGNTIPTIFTQIIADKIEEMISEKRTIIVKIKK